VSRLPGWHTGNHGTWMWGATDVPDVPTYEPFRHERPTTPSVMSVFEASARTVGGSLRSEVDVNGRHTITTDEPLSLGGSDTAPAPHELLPAMVASCVSTMIVLYARQRHWRLDEARVDVTYDSDVAPRNVTVSVHLPDSLTPDQVDRLRRVARTCPVRRAFEAGFAFEERLVLDPPGDEDEPSRDRENHRARVRGAGDLTVISERDAFTFRPRGTGLAADGRGAARIVSRTG
jgi:putative redox protein